MGSNFPCDPDGQAVEMMDGGVYKKCEGDVHGLNDIFVSFQGPSMGH